MDLAQIQSFFIKYGINYVLAKSYIKGEGVMLERQYCASAYTIDFENKKVLLMYNKKLTIIKHIKN